MAEEKYFNDPSAIGVERVLNRVDAHTGKAHDFYKIWEITSPEVREFKSKITLNLPDRTEWGQAVSLETMKSFLAGSLALVETLCGSLCRIFIGDDDGFRLRESDAFLSAQDPTGLAVVRNLAENLANTVRDTFDPSRESNKLRSFADLAFGLRQLNSISLKSIEENTQGPLWKSAGENNAILRDELLRIWRDEQNQNYLQKHWRFFCEHLGQAVHDRAQEQSRSLSPGRSLGAAPLDDRTAKEDRFVGQEQRLNSIRNQEWIITGVLEAMTPFHVGIAAESGRHVDQAILLDDNNAFRLPRSTLRGALRRDLGLALSGFTCRAELAPEAPCLCDACQILRQLKTLDAVSNSTMPPEIRHRLRLNQESGTVDESALFNCELGIQGMCFPLVIRMRTEETPPQAIWNVLAWWQKGRLFLGGFSGTGKGRFRLKKLRVARWDLSVPGALQDYLKCQGLRGKENSLLDDSPRGLSEYHSVTTTNSRELVNLGGNITEPALVYTEQIHYPRFPWREITWGLQFDGPLLTSDPIQAGLSHEADAVYFQKMVIEENDQVVSKPALRGEGMRGILRTTLGRRHKLFDQTHDDCQCLVCRIFGNEHHQGMVRVEDMTLTPHLNPPSPSARRLDHVAIDRISGGAADTRKFDDMPLVGSPDDPLIFGGKLWLHEEVDQGLLDSLARALVDIKSQRLPVGGKGSIGYGWVSELELDDDEPMQDAASPLIAAWQCVSSNQEQRIDETGQKDHKAEEVDPQHDPAVDWPDLPELTLDIQRNYNPYYFLPPDKKADSQDGPYVHRETTLPSHSHFAWNLYAGYLKCKLISKTPLIIPDTESDNTLGMEDPPTGHKAYGFFRLGNTVAIPGASLRGMISSVYETVTDSCFRIMDQKSRLSWRMDARNDPSQFKPGRVIAENGELFVLEMRSKDRLPIYDHNNPDAINNWKKIIEQPEIARGASKTTVAHLNTSNRHDTHAKLVGLNGGDSYIKFTGPNMVNIANISAVNTGDLPADWSEAFFNCPDDGPQYYQVINGGRQFTMIKKYERVFYNAPSEEKRERIPAAVRDRFEQLMREYLKNAEREDIPHVFRTTTYFTSQKLEHGDLIYFRRNASGEVEDIIPVAISRWVDTGCLGMRMAEKDFLPCAHVCLDDCETCLARVGPHPWYREGEPLKGLCPGCSLFGAQGYKGRVRFGFAELDGEAKWLIKGDEPVQRRLTLPLQERPRLTWVISRDENSKIPGRKYYVHHQGWRTVLRGRNPIDQTEIRPNANNCTVEPLDGGNELSFEVRFENLRDWELGLLLYSLELEPGLAHKLGRGKALGFGSVEIKVDRIALQQNGEPGQNPEVAPTPTAELDQQPAATPGKQELLRAGQDWLQKHHFGDSRPGLWHEIPRMEKLRNLMRYQEDETLRVCFPDLQAHVDLKKNGYNPGERLKTPWDPWR
ncbi:MAG: TIGR03986 family CRISPR-associated RAMP protein [Proteobacteria bacterium]|nr:TIGR03986 family CRISPR-associated RAMP protein [Pseudomonadota bacterium]